MAFIITTTGAPATVIINDLGARTFVHPVVSYNLETEYTPFELSQSADLQTAITGGEITAVDGSGNPITIVDQLIDLQSAYNSSANPEIVTDATLGAVTIKRGSAADTDNVLETKNGAGSNTFEVTGAGKVTGTDFNDVALTTGGVATNYLDETGAYSAPASGGVTSVTGTTPIASSGGATPDISISAATTGAAGSMSSADKTKLDGIATGAQPGTITGIAVSLPLTTTGGTAPALDINPATVMLPGVMSAADKTKLNGLSANTNIGTTNLTLAGNRRLDLDGKSLGFTNASLGMAIGAIAADASAILDLNSTTEGFLPPRMNTLQMVTIGSPAEGLMIFNTSTKQWMGYNGTSWVILG